MASTSTSKSLDQFNNPVNIKDGTTAPLRSPGAGIVGADAVPRLPLGWHSATWKPVVFDFQGLYDLIYSASLSWAILRNTTPKPQSADAGDPWQLQVVSALVPDCLHARYVDFPEWKQVQAEAAAHADKSLVDFLDELHEHGPSSAIDFLAKLEAGREYAIQSTEAIYRNTSRWNGQNESSLKVIHETLVQVRLAATLTVAALSLPTAGPSVAALGWAGAGEATGWGAFAIGTWYSLSLDEAKNPSSKDPVNLVVGSLAKAKDQGLKKGVKVIAKAAKDYGEKYAAKLAAAGGKSAAQNAYRLNLNRLLKALGSVPYLFFLWTSYDAWKDEVHDSQFMHASH